MVGLRKQELLQATDRQNMTRKQPRLRLLRTLATLGVLLTFALPQPARAIATAGACEQAARRAAAATGVPEKILLAIALAESGRRVGGRFVPWPWTVNAAGEGRWFASRGEALAFARRRLESGARNFDMGCFQINFRWHGHAFVSLTEMLDPLAGALYAGRLLRRLHAESDNWVAAAGAYHSRTESHARRYRARFAQILAGLEDGPASAARGQTDPAWPAVRPAEGGQLLALAGASGPSLGSLVPRSAAARAPLLIGMQP